MDRDRVQLFDDWAEDYDASVEHSSGTFPFDGYGRVLDEIVQLANAGPGMNVLDLGTGTGKLAAPFVRLGCAVWGVDFSARMLEKARRNVPPATFVQTDLLGEWPAELARRFDRIVSAYTLHHFDLADKVGLLRRLVDRHLTGDGRIVVGDIAFRSGEDREEAHRRWAQGWDEDEFYWAADETLRACEEAGLKATYRQVSSCAGVFVIEGR